MALSGQDSPVQGAGALTWLPCPSSGPVSAMGIVVLIMPMPIVYTIAHALGVQPDFCWLTLFGTTGSSSTWPLLVVSNGLAIRVVMLGGSVAVAVYATRVRDELGAFLQERQPAHVIRTFSSTSPTTASSTYSTPLYHCECGITWGGPWQHLGECLNCDGTPYDHTADGLDLPFKLPEHDDGMGYWRHLDKFDRTRTPSPAELAVHDLPENFAADYYWNGSAWVQALAARVMQLGAVCVYVLSQMLTFIYRISWSRSRSSPMTTTHLLPPRTTPATGCRMAPLLRLVLLRCPILSVKSSFSSIEFLSVWCASRPLFQRCMLGLTFAFSEVFVAFWCVDLRVFPSDTFTLFTAFIFMTAAIIFQWSRTASILQVATLIRCASVHSLMMWLLHNQFYGAGFITLCLQFNARVVCSFFLKCV